MVTKEGLWAKVNEDPEMQRQTEAVREALRPYIEAAPAVLADLLDKPAIFTNIVQAKVRFIRYCIDNGFIKNIVVAMPDGALNLFSSDDVSEMLQKTLNLLSDMSRGLLADLPAFLKKYGMTEDQIILSPEMGLNAEARKLYGAGQLTIEKLLLVQPTIILKNTA